MKALDTNILVRFLTKDDGAQAERVYRLFKTAEENKEVFFVPVLVVLELLWVLESAYDISQQDILDAFDELLLLPVLEFDAQDAVRACIADARRSKCDLSDLLIAHYAVLSGESDQVLTFDRKAAKSGIFHLLKDT